MTDRIRIAVAGGGLIAQVEHLPNLIALSRRFEVAAVSDPSATVRAALSERFGIPAVAEAGDLAAFEVDALLVAAPDPWHGALAVAAMQAGLHVFCEKPLCYGPAEIDALIDARDQAGVVLQVGYMKRLDPAYRIALDLVAGRAETLRYVSVEVHDPDAWPFIAHRPVVAGTDVPSAMREETAARRRRQVEAALGFAPDDLIMRGFCGPYSSSLVHDVNAVHGLLDAAGVAVGPVSGAAIFADGVGGQAAVSLDGDRALWSMAHFETPGMAEYGERIAFHFEDGLVELRFPSPYLNHFPTRLRAISSRGHRREMTDIRDGYAEAFVRELEAFADAVTGIGTAPNPAEDARRDQALLVEMARRAAGRT